MVRWSPATQTRARVPASPDAVRLWHNIRAGIPKEYAPETAIYTFCLHAAFGPTRQRLKLAVPAVALGLYLLTTQVAAQSPSGTAPGAPSTQPPPNVTAPTSTSTAVTTAPPAAELVRNNPAAPLPTPNLASSAALPPRRGYIRVEPIDVYPSLGFGLGWTDNLLGQSSNPISTGFVLVSPRLQAEVQTGGHIHALRYGGSYGKYFSSSADNFAIHEFVGSTRNQFTARADLAATAYYLIQQDPRGLTSRAISTEPDRWNGYGARVTFGYGALSAPGRLEFDLGATEKSYVNNESITQDLNVGTVDAAGRFFLRAGPRTRLFTEVRLTRFDYLTGRYSNEEARVLGGVSWDLSASTSGTFKAGYVRKDFDQSALADYRAFTSELALRYFIRSYSVVEVAAGRVPSDFYGTGYFNVDTYATAAWTHRFASFLSTRAFLSHLIQDVRGVNRTDATTAIGLGSYFDVRTWMRLGVELQHSRRTSDDLAFEYSRNLLLFTIGATL